MKRLILILALLPSVVYAGSKVFDPDGDVTQGADWTGCDSASFYLCVSDDVDAQDLSHYDNNNLSDVTFTVEDNGGTIDTTIDSVTYVVKWQTDNVANTFAIFDSIDGGDAGRVSSTISTGTADVWQTDSVTYTTQADGASSWIWDDFENLIVGARIVAKNNNKTLMVTEEWVRVWWTTPAAGGAYKGQVISIGGN